MIKKKYNSSLKSSPKTFQYKIVQTVQKNSKTSSHVNSRTKV